MNDIYKAVEAIGGRREDAIGIKLRAELMHLPVDRIDPDPDQPRQEFDAAALRRLADSLRTFGQLQPIVVRPVGSRYMIVAGERRWRAAKLAGMPRIQAITCRGGDTVSIQLVENLLREDLKPVEQAKAYDAIMKREGWSARELARQLNIEHSGVCRALALLELEPDVQGMVDSGRIAKTTAYEITKKPSEDRRKLAIAVATGRLTGKDLRAKPDPLPEPGPPVVLPRYKDAPILTLGSAPIRTWRHESGNARVTVDGCRSTSEVADALRAALAAVEKMPKLNGGVS